MLTTTKSFIKCSSRVLLAGLFCLTTAAYADLEKNKDNNFRVSLIATVDNGPAMREVNWRVYRVGTSDDENSVTIAKNHSTHINIPPGKYRVIATLKENDKEITRERKFYVQTNSQVIVPMD